MRMEQLKYLVDVAETKSMSKTAERMFVSPQAVSQSIKQLETELDATLLVRNSMGVSLTRIGEAVVERAKRMLEEETQIGQMIAESKQRNTEGNIVSLRICSTSVVTNIVLPSILAEMKRMGIDVVPRIYMVDSLEELLEHVRTDTCDIGLVTFNAEELFRRFVQYQNDLELNLLA